MEEVDRVLSLVHRGLQSTRRRSVDLGSPRDVRNVTLALTSSEASLIAAALCCYKEVKSDQLFHRQLGHIQFNIPHLNPGGVGVNSALQCAVGWGVTGCKYPSMIRIWSRHRLFV